MKHLIKIENLRKSYGDFRLDLSELYVEAGTIMGLIGSNGAGKTTTIKAMLRIINPEGGMIELLGCSASNARQFTVAKSRVGVVFDTCPFPPDLTVKDVSLMGRAVYAQWNQTSFDDLAARFALSPKKQVIELSRGMGMKLQLAFAIAHDPELLILDEPTAGLDPMARLDVLDLLRSLIDEKRAALISTHITSDLEKIADHVACIDAGRLVFSESIDVICDQAGLVTCRASELEELCAAEIFEAGELRVIHEPYSEKVLVPKRLKVAKAFPSLTCERASLETYMTFMLKGEAR